MPELLVDSYCEDANKNLEATKSSENLHGENLGQLPDIANELAATFLATMHTEFAEDEEDELAATFLATMHTEFTENEEDELAATFLATMHIEFTENEEDELAAIFLATMHTEFIENVPDIVNLGSSYFCVLECTVDCLNEVPTSSDSS